jgi:Polyketide cyclase / dehydrase and lipid transport
MENSISVACSVDIDSSCEEVFDVVHDYGIRLQWDTLLSEARILDERLAGVGVSTLCVGRTALGRIAMETSYVSFDRGRVAAVKMQRGPWFIDDFAASIRHTAIAETVGNRSRVTYKLRVTAWPKLFRFLLNPLLQLAFRVETGRRLSAWIPAASSGRRPRSSPPSTQARPPLVRARNGRYSTRSSTTPCAASFTVYPSAKEPRS